MNNFLYHVAKLFFFILGILLGILFSFLGLSICYYGFSVLTSIPTTWFSFILANLIGLFFLKWGVNIVYRMCDNWY